MIKKTQSFSIGTLAKKTGCKVPTIRYYEEKGLLHEPHRTEGNQRRYAESHLKRLQFIRHARELGFSQEDIRELIFLSIQTESNHQADEIAIRHLKEVKNKIASLNTLKKELSSMLDECKRGHPANCSVIDVLSNHTLCKSEH
jgi:DNA-binding transcriptional MerR regulator